MRAVSISNIKEGNILGKSIYSSEGRLLLSKGMELDKKLVSTLRKHQIMYVYIEDRISEGIEIHSIVDEKIIIETIGTMKKIFDMAMYRSKGKEKMEWIPLQAHLEVQNVIENILYNLKENENVLYSMTELMGTDMYTYKHSVNVSILAILTARSLGIGEKEIRDVAMGALLHDLGKTRIEPDILNKTREFTEEEIELIGKHPEYGYDIVKNDLSLSYITKQIIYSHHELLDGSGYPRKLKGDEISIYSMIVTICDMFDSMTSDKFGRRKMSIYKTLEIMSAKIFDKLDANVYNRFIENIAIYPIGTGVILEDGRKGIVVDIHRSCPTRPILRIIEDKGNAEYYEIDLMKNLTIFISDVIDLDNIK